MKSIASFNGLEATRAAYRAMAGGSLPLDAVVEGITLIEDDPLEHTVGYGGLPAEDGKVTLDAAVMDGKTARGGGVIGLTDVRHAAQVAAAVMRLTNRVLLHGEGARRFALDQGFPAEDLLTEKARQVWRYWKRMNQRGHEWRPPSEGEFSPEVIATYEKLWKQPAGTVHAAAVDAQGELACGTSTSGHCFKMPGRVGDSPIFGAGLYCDGQVGTCGSIGHGEANLLSCSSFLAVQKMKQGATPVEAGLTTLREIVDRAALWGGFNEAKPPFEVQLFLLNKQGEHAGVCIAGKRDYAITDQQGSRLEPCATIYNT